MTTKAPPQQDEFAVVKHKTVLEGKQDLMVLLRDPALLKQMKQIASKAIDPQQVLHLMMLAGSRQPAIFNCTPASVIQALMRAAETGLGFTRNEAYAVPFRNGKTGCKELTFIPGYQGMVKLARQSGQIVKIEARLRHHNDQFEIHYGTDPRIEHTPCVDNDPGPVVGSYAVATYPDGTTQFEYMRRDELDGIRRRSKAKNNGPWVTDEGEMQKKCPVRRMFKYLPKTRELDKAIEYDNEATGYEDAGEIIDTTVEEGRSRSENLADKLEGEKNGSKPPTRKPTKKTPSKGTPRKPKKSPDEIRADIDKMLLEISGGDEDAAANYLEQTTEWWELNDKTGEQELRAKGKRSTADLSDKQVPIIYRQVKEVYKEFEAKQHTGQDGEPPADEAPAEDDDQLPFD